MEVLAAIRRAGTQLITPSKIPPWRICSGSGCVRARYLPSNLDEVYEREKDIRYSSWSQLATNTLY